MAGLPFNLSVPLNLSQPSSAVSGIVDTAPVSNEGFTGSFNVGRGSAGATSSTPTLTGGATSNPNFSGAPVPQQPGIGGSLAGFDLNAGNLLLFLAVFALVVMQKKGRI